MTVRLCSFLLIDDVPHKILLPDFVGPFAMDANKGEAMPEKTKDLVALNCRRRTAGVEFSYEKVPASIEKLLRSQAERIRQQTANCVIQIGKALLEAKRHLTHGAFSRWVEGEVGIPCRTAQAYMRAAQWAAGKSATVARLPPSAIYMLSSRGVSEEFVRDVLQRVEAGERITSGYIRQQIAINFKMGEGKNIINSASMTEKKAKMSTEPLPICLSISELAVFLAQRLSSDDFTRVCKILTKQSLLSDPGLSRRLEQQFRARYEA